SRANFWAYMRSVKALPNSFTSDKPSWRSREGSNTLSTPSLTIRRWQNATRSPPWTASTGCRDLGRSPSKPMSFSQHLRQLAQSIWDAQLTHPFVAALGNGTLSERKFRYYILQDARFLGELARVFSAG